MKVKLNKKYVLIVSAILLVLIGIGITWVNSNPDYKEYRGVTMRPSLDIADNLEVGTGVEQFEKMVTSVGFNQFLHDKGPFTVFVPTDQAYANLTAEQKSKLSQPEEEGTLRQLLLYHVVKGKYMDTDLKDGMILTTLEGEKLQFNKYKGNWLINGYAYFSTYDIETKNGVIHTVTSYLLPPSLLL